NIFGTLNVEGSITQTAVYIVTPNTTQCGDGSPFTLTVTVNPSIIFRSFSVTRCSGEPFEYTPTDGQNGNVIPEGTRYTWSAPAGSGFSGGVAEPISRTSISGTLTATSNFIATATYFVTPSVTSCSVVGTFTVMVNVTPFPNVNPMSRTTCGGVFFNAVPQNNTDGLVPSGTQYTWNAPSVTTASLSGGDTRSTVQNSIFGTLTNQTNTPQTAVYTVTSYLNACQGNVFTLTVNVNPRPILQNVVTTTCSNSPFTVSPTTTSVNNIAPLGTTYSWGVPQLSASLTGGESASGQNFISGTLTNPTNTVLTAAYMVTPIGPAEYGACVGNPFTITVNVNPRPVVAGIFRTECSGVTFVVSPTNGGGNVVPLNTTYTWNAAPIVTSLSLTGGGVGTNVSFVTGTLFNGTPVAQTATYTVTPSFSGCAGSAFQVTITVNPAATIATMSTTTCSGTQFTVTPSASLPGNIIPANTTYTWLEPTYQNPALSGGVSISTPQNDVFGTVNNSSNITYFATYTVRPTTGICLGNTFQVLAYIQPKPLVNEMSIVSCAGVIPVVPTNNINGTSIPTNAVYTWGIPTYSSSSLTGGNSGSQTGGITQNLINTSSVTQTATYTVIPSFGTCGNSNPFTLTFFVNPRPAITNLQTVVCTGSPFSVTPVTGGTNFVPTGTLFTWGMPSPQNASLSGGQASSFSSTNIFGTITNPTNTQYYMRYSVTGATNLCVGNTFLVDAYIDPKPSVTPMSATICSGVFSVVPVNGTNGIVPSNTVYTWSTPQRSTTSLTGGVGASATGSINGTLTNSTSETQTAVYTVTPTFGTCNGVNAGTAFTVTVFVNPRANIGIINRTICTGTSFVVTPTNGTDGFVPDGTTYTWSTPSATSLSVTGGQSRTSASNNIFGGPLINPTSTAQTVVYQVTPMTNGCPGSAFTVVVTIDPKPAITAMSTVICNGVFAVTPIDGTNGVVPANTFYSWNAPTVSDISLTGGQTSSALNNIIGNLTNNTNFTQTAVYLVTPTFGACNSSNAGIPFTVTVFVNPRPVISTMTSVICTGATFNVTPTNGVNGFVPTGTTFSWPEPIYSNPAISGGQSASPGQISVFGTLYNSSNRAYTATYNVVAETPNCGGVTFSVIVTVNPIPVVDALSTTVCSGVTFALTPVTGSVVPAATNMRYSWTYIASSSASMTGSSGSSSVGNLFAGILNNATNVMQTATYNVVPIYSNGGLECSGAAFSATVFVNPTPLVTSPINLVRCTGSPFEISPTNVTSGIVPDNTTYSWSAPAAALSGVSGATNAVSISGTLSHGTNAPILAVYNVVPRGPSNLGSCVGSTFVVNVTVNPIPAVNALSTTVCSGVLFVMSPVTGSVVPAVGNMRYSWTYLASSSTSMTGSNGSSSVGNLFTGILNNGTNVMQTATYNVVPIYSNGGLECSGAAFSATVFVNPTPLVTSITLSPLCTGSTFAVTPSAGNIPSNTVYGWGVPVTLGGGTIEGGQGSAFSSTNIFSIAPLTNATKARYTLQYTVTPQAGNCVGSQFNVDVPIDPKPFVPALSTTICNGVFVVTPTPTTNGTDGVVPVNTVYNWSVPPVMSTASMTSSGPNNATGNITGTLTNNTSVTQTAVYLVTPSFGACTGDVFSLTVFVNPAPSINTINRTICTGTSFVVTPTNGTDGFVPDGTTYTWGSPVHLTSSVSGGVANAVTSTNIYGGPLTNTSSVPLTVSYPVYAVQGSCGGAAFTLVITVDPKPQVNAMSTVRCSGVGFVVSPVDGTNGLVPSNTRYAWNAPTGSNIGGGAAASNQTTINGTLTNGVNVQRTATYIVIPSYGACSGLTQSGSPFTVTVFVDPTPSITSPINLVRCSGSPFEVSPTNVTNGIVPDNTTYSWSAPTAALSGVSGATNAVSISGTLSHGTNAPILAVYNVVPRGPSNLGSCVGSTFVVNVTVNPIPAVNALSTTVCSGVTFAMTPVTGSVVPAATNMRYSWTYIASSSVSLTGGVNGSSTVGNLFTGLLTNATNVMQTATYNVVPIYSNGGVECSGAAFSATVFVNPAAIISTINTTVCSGVTFRVTPTSPSNGVVPEGTTYQWQSPVYENPSLTGGAAGALGQIDIFGTIDNPTNTRYYARYSVVPTTGICVGATFIVNAFINPIPSVTSTLTATICSGQTFSVSPTNGIDGSVPVATNMFYTWGAPQRSSTLLTGGVSGNSGVGGSINGTLTNGTNSLQTAVYSVTPIYTNSGVNCAGSNFTVVVFVNSRAVINTMTEVTCSGAPFNITPTNGVHGIVPLGTTYTWFEPTYTAGLSGGAAMPISQTSIFGTISSTSSSIQTATYTVVPTTVDCGPNNPFTLLVTVYPRPLINAMTTVTCSGIPFAVSPADITNGRVPVNNTYSWNVPTYTSSLSGGVSRTGQPNIFGLINSTSNQVETATYTVTPTSQYNCVGTPFTLTVTVNPGGFITAMTTTTCSGVMFNVTPVNGTNGVVPDNTQYTWEAPNYTGTVTGGVSSNGRKDGIFGTLTNQTNITQTVTYLVTAFPPTGSCANNTFTVTVTLFPAPQINEMSTVICSGVGFVVAATNVVNGIVPVNTQYIW
ncbi:MAG: hypothetical protein IM577_05090, partial [Chitinophagaceae bacterium]|nr:hypothetical protein [Chitinophagaceae bacterium]